MNFVLLIDYANLYFTIKNSHPTPPEEAVVVKEIEEIIHALEEKLNKQPNSFSKKGIRITKMVAYVLDLPSLGKPEKYFNSMSMEIVRVASSKKSDVMKEMNQSRDDDSELMRRALDFISKGGTDGVIVCSNDGDFSSLAEKVRYAGRYFWSAIYETEKSRAAVRLKRAADTVIPLQELVANMEQAEPLPLTEEIRRETIAPIFAPHLELYCRGEIIMTYPLDRNVIEIGRRSTSMLHYPQIDLTDFDIERIVSRKHAKIQRIGGKLLFLVHQDCSRGTWRDGSIVYPCEQFFLEPDMQIVLGSDEGFGLIYKLS